MNMLSLYDSQVIPSLINMPTSIDGIYVQDGSNTVFAYQNGNPLEGMNIDKMTRDAGAKLTFTGHKGEDKADVMRKFMEGGRDRREAATERQDIREALRAQSANMKDLSDGVRTSIAERRAEMAARRKSHLLLLL